MKLSTSARSVAVLILLLIFTIRRQLVLLASRIFNGPVGTGGLGLIVSRLTSIHYWLRRKRSRRSPAGSPTRDLQINIDYVISRCRRDAACSPITTQGAIVLPVVTRGRMEASAIRRPSTP